MTRTDKILILLMIAVSLVGAAVLHLPTVPRDDSVAVIKVQGETVQTVDLNAAGGHRIPTEGVLGNSVLEVREGRIRMMASPCPDKLCIDQGWASKPGQSIVCVPNAVSVTIQGNGGVDSIVR